MGPRFRWDDSIWSDEPDSVSYHVRQRVDSSRHDLIRRYDDLEQDQQDDDDFQAQGPLGVDHIRQHLCGIGNDGELARQGLSALLEFVLVLQACGEPLEIRAVPYHIRLFRDRYAA